MWRVPSLAGSPSGLPREPWPSHSSAPARRSRAQCRRTPARPGIHRPARGRRAAGRHGAAPPDPGRLSDDSAVPGLAPARRHLQVHRGRQPHRDPAHPGALDVRHPGQRDRPVEPGQRPGLGPADNRQPAGTPPRSGSGTSTTSGIRRHACPAATRGSGSPPRCPPHDRCGYASSGTVPAPAGRWPGEQRLGAGVGRHHHALARGQVQATELLQRQQAVRDAEERATGGRPR